MKRRTLVDLSKQLMCAAAVMIAVMYAVGHEEVSATQIRSVIFVQAVR